MPASTSNDLGACPFCGVLYEEAPDRCDECGGVINGPAEDLENLIRSGRKGANSRKAIADGFFLVGLLVGGPMISIGAAPQLGLYVVLAAGFVSIVHRKTEWSTPGTVLIGSLGAMVAASVLIDPASDVPEDTLPAEEARAAFAGALDAQFPDVLVHTRGSGHISIWFAPPPEGAGKCGQYPDSRVRKHLEDLGFLRVVVTAPNQSGGLCSFKP